MRNSSDAQNRVNPELRTFAPKVASSAWFRPVLGVIRKGVWQEWVLRAILRVDSFLSTPNLGLEFRLLRSRESSQGDCASRRQSHTACR